jgi:hypothetical protein
MCALKRGDDAEIPIEAAASPADTIRGRRVLRVRDARLSK